MGFGRFLVIMAVLASADVVSVIGNFY